MKEDEYQTTAGQLGPCCVSMIMALHVGYIRKGYLWYKKSPPQWIGWSIKVAGKGFYDVSPIHFCPFCGTNLDRMEN